MGPIDQTTRDGEAKKALVSYQDILKAQVEEKKRIKAEEKEKERAEEEREAARIVEEQQKLKEKFEAEQLKQREKDERIKAENEERKLEAEKKREYVIYLLCCGIKRLPLLNVYFTNRFFNAPFPLLKEPLLNSRSNWMTNWIKKLISKVKLHTTKGQHHQFL